MFSLEFGFCSAVRQRDVEQVVCGNLDAALNLHVLATKFVYLG